MGIFVWELFLEIRQRIALSGKKPPKSLTKIIDQATFTKANAYNIDKWNFKQFSSIYSTAQILYALYFDFFALVWVKSAELLKTSALVETTEVAFICCTFLTSKTGYSIAGICCNSHCPQLSLEHSHVALLYLCR